MQAQVSCHLSYRCVVDVWAMFTKYVPGTQYCGVMAYVCTKCSVYVHVLTLDVCMEEWVLCLHILAINTTTVKVSSEAMAQMVECSLTMWEVLGSKPSWVCVFVVVDVGAIFFYLQKMMQKYFFQKTNYQATWVLWYRCLIWILLLLLFQTTEKIRFYLKWKKGHNSAKFQNYYKMIVSAS